METTTVGEVQKNFSSVLKKIRAGEEIIVTKRGRPVAKITSLGARQNIEWPDFFRDSVEIEGTSLSDMVIEGREDRF